MPIGAIIALKDRHRGYGGAQRCAVVAAAGAAVSGPLVLAPVPPPRHPWAARPAGRGRGGELTPEAAGERLAEVRPFKAAAAILQPMNPDVSIGILAAMPGWGPKSILPEMPQDIAGPLLTRLRQDPVTSRRWDLDFNLPR